MNTPNFKTGIVRPEDGSLPTRRAQKHARQARLLDLIRNGLQGVDRYAAELGVTYRTVMRDLRELKANGQITATKTDFPATTTYQAPVVTFGALTDESSLKGDCVSIASITENTSSCTPNVTTGSDICTPNVTTGSHYPERLLRLRERALQGVWEKQSRVQGESPWLKKKSASRY